MQVRASHDRPLSSGKIAVARRSSTSRGALASLLTDRVGEFAPSRQASVDLLSRWLGISPSSPVPSRRPLVSGEFGCISETGVA